MIDFDRFKIVPGRGQLALQLAESIESAARNGVLRPGERLPTVAQWAGALGVSEFVPRRAMGLLAKKGVLEIKRHVGASVSHRYAHSQKKKVIFLSVDNGDIWARNAFSFRLGEELRKAGCRYERVAIPRSGRFGVHSSREFSFAPLEDALAGGVDFAWVECSRPWVAQRLADAGVPFAVCDSGGGDYPGAVDVFRGDSEGVARELVSRLRAARVDTLALVGPGPEVDDRISTYLCASGIGFRRIGIDLSRGRACVELWQRQAMNVFDRMLSTGRDWLPDAFFFTDDGIASGALLAMARHGVESPRDVKVVVLSNKGFGPVYFRPLSRLENDPSRNAAEVARYVVSRLKGRISTPPPPDISRRFIPGATL